MMQVGRLEAIKKSGLNRDLQNRVVALRYNAGARSFDLLMDDTADGTFNPTTTILDNDETALPTVTLAVDNAEISETGGVATFTLTLSAAATADVTAPPSAPRPSVVPSDSDPQEP